MTVHRIPEAVRVSDLPHGYAPDGSCKTTNFQAWFAGSTVMSGELPQVMYHGTASNFRIFKHSKDDIGFHFGSLDQAKVRLAHSLKKRLHKAEGQRILEVYLHIKNPLRLYDSGFWDVDDMKHHLQRWFPEDRHIFGSVDYDTGFKTNQQVRDYLASKGYDGIVYANTGEVSGAELLEKAVEKARRNLYKRFPEAKKFLRKEHLESDEFKLLTLAEDADQAFRDANAKDSLIAFEPWQIKSIYNSGYFDPESNDMMDSTTKRVKRSIRRTSSYLNEVA